MVRQPAVLLQAGIQPEVSVNRRHPLDRGQCFLSGKADHLIARTQLVRSSSSSQHGPLAWVANTEVWSS